MFMEAHITVTDLYSLAETLTQHSFTGVLSCFELIVLGQVQC